VAGGGQRSVDARSDELLCIAVMFYESSWHLSSFFSVELSPAVE